jgi:hypothetical protein
MMILTLTDLMILMILMGLKMTMMEHLGEDVEDVNVDDGNESDQLEKDLNEDDEKSDGV